MKKNLIRPGLYFSISALFITGVFIYIFFWIGDYPTQESEYGNLVEDFFKAIAGIAIIFTALSASKRARAMEKNVEYQSKQIELTRDAQINEQFKNAIDHLGSDNKYIKIGGIAQLNHLAKLEPSKYAEVVNTIFCNLIRTEANYTKSNDEIEWDLVSLALNHLLSNTELIPLNKELSKTNLSLVDLNNTIVNATLNSSILPNNTTLLSIENCRLIKSKLIDCYTSVIIKNSLTNGFSCIDSSFNLVFSTNSSDSSDIYFFNTYLDCFEYNVEKGIIHSINSDFDNAKINFLISGRLTSYCTSFENTSILIKGTPLSSKFIACTFKKSILEMKNSKLRLVGVNTDNITFSSDDISSNYNYVKDNELDISGMEFIPQSKFIQNKKLNDTHRLSILKVYNHFLKRCGYFELNNNSFPISELKIED